MSHVRDRYLSHPSLFDLPEDERMEWPVLLQPNGQDFEGCLLPEPVGWPRAVLAGMALAHWRRARVSD
jgi:hypothetical protein